MKPKENKKSKGQHEPTGYDQCGTPHWAVNPLPIKNNANIWECASGKGDLALALHRMGHNVFASELDTQITDTVYPIDEMGLGVNFLTDNPLGVDEYFYRGFDYIITNPPYSGDLKQVFTERCYYYYKTYGIPFALLMPVEFLGTGSAQRIFDTHGGLQVIYMDTRVDFRMPEIGWTGKSTNKIKKNSKGKWVRQAGAQFPVCWYTVGFNLPRDIMFAKLKPYKMETLNDPYNWMNEDNHLSQLELLS